MKTYKQQAIELISTGNVKLIKNNVTTLATYIADRGETINNIAVELLKMISENSNDFTKDIAEKKLETLNNENFTGSRDFTIELSDKQSWCVAYQIINNLEVYKQ